MAEKIKTISLRKKLAAAMLITPILSSLIIFGFYYGYMKDFYREKVEIFQENNRKTMAANVKNILRQVENVSGQLLGMAVLSGDFEDYTSKEPYEKLLLNREVSAQLTNICISNDLIDNIYMLDFDGNGFTSNSEWNKQAYLETLDGQPDREQKGRTVILPPHPAKYRHLGNASSAAYMVSFVTYLNRYTKSGAIGQIQMDIPYKKLKKSVEFLEMTQEDFAFVADKDGYLIYAPREEDAGKHASQVDYGDWNLGELWLSQKQGGQGNTSVQENRPVQGNASVQGSTSVKSVKMDSVDWTLIQVNSSTMLRQELGRMQRTWILIFLICLLCAGGLSLSLSHSITKPMMNLIKSMGKVSKGNFNIQVNEPANKDLAALVSSFNTMILEVDTLMKENIQKEHEKTKMAMMALNAKINSHFLYNTLNTIKWQAIAQNQMEIANSIVALTKILEYSYKNTLDLVPLREELQFIEDYILIQNMRYLSKVSIKYQLDPGCEDCLVLKMLLQPIVENALLHAFEEGKEDNEITLTCTIRDRYMQVKIRDNGKGFLYEGFHKLTGIGLNNVRDRLALNFGEDGKLEIHSTVGEGTCVTVLFPVLREGKDG